MLSSPPLLRYPDIYRKEIVVAPDGRNFNSGTLESPLQSIGAATYLAKEVGVSRIVLRDGTYRISAPIKPYTGQSIVAYPGERPVISGGVPVTNWQVYSGDIIRAPRTHKFRQLYINGNKAVLSRSPFYKILHWWDVEGIAVNEVARQTGRVIAISTSDYQAAGSPGVGTLFVFQRDWSDAYMPILSVSTAGNKTFLTFTPEITKLAFDAGAPAKHAPYSYHFENLPNLAPGSWRYDDSWIYYQLKQNELISNIDAVAPFTETLLDISSDGVTIDGLEFSHSNYWFEKGRHVFQAASLYYLDEQDPTAPAAVKITKCSDAVITRCNFTNIGARALDLGVGSNNALIEGNRFNGLAGGAIAMVGPTLKTYQGEAYFISYVTDASLSQQCRNHTIKNNKIENHSLEYFGSPAVVGAYTNNCAITQNTIQTGPYTAISMGWGWVNDLTTASKTTITGNKIFGACNLLTDGGAIYTLGAAPDSVISGNFIDGVAGNDHSYRKVNTAIYLDAGTEGFTISFNFYDNISFIAEGPAYSGGPYNSVGAFYSNASNLNNSVSIPLPRADGTHYVNSSGLQQHWS